ITCTGSTEVGKILIRQSADKVKSLSLELGGHVPLIVKDDADLDNAVAGVMASKFSNAGKSLNYDNCGYVQSGIYDALYEKFVMVVKQFKVGYGIDESVDIGPLINRDGLDKVTHHVEEAVAKGASVVTGGKPITDGNGVFYSPTVLGNVDPSMVIMQEETFGPVAPVRKIETAAE